MRNYDGLTREELIARLSAAEDVCVLYGWSALASPTAGDRELATLQRWMEWSAIPGVPLGRQGNPHLSNEAIAELARRRREIRASTLVRLEGPPR